MGGNAGFIGLHNPMGLLAIVFGALLFLAIIVFGAKLVKVKEASDKEYRASLRRQLEAQRDKQD